ncbi:MAG: hypothetical protein ACREFB_12985, partial [Stellaceae bacterium]
MTRDHKGEESEFLHSFRYFCPDFPAGPIAEGETPDFIIERCGYRVGIEITRIFTGDGRNKGAQQSIEAARERITALSKKMTDDMGVPPRGVTLFFNWTLPLYRRAEGRIAQGVAQAVRDRLPPTDQTADLECRLDSPQPREVDQILVHRVNEIEGFDWKWMEASRRVENAIPLIEGAIERKLKTAEICFGKCDECWLLIVAGEPLLRA